MNKERVEQNFYKEWGYTQKHCARRALTEDEHQELLKIRKDTRKRLEAQRSHALKLSELFRVSDPKIKGNEIVQVVDSGSKSFEFICDQIGFEVARGKFHFGAEIKRGWLVSIADAEDLIARFPEHIHYPNDKDIERDLLQTVSPYGWDPANLDDMFKD